jgi:hypothetical protein
MSLLIPEKALAVSIRWATVLRPKELVKLHVAKRYGLLCVWQDIFSSPEELLRPALGLTQPPIKLVLGIFPISKGGRGVKLTTYLYLVPRLRMGWAISLFPLHSFKAWTAKRCPFYLPWFEKYFKMSSALRSPLTYCEWSRKWSVLS